jgi:DNA processing protein
VVSGLARGIDTAAHEAALATGTMAVQAGGVDVIYPEENAALPRDDAAAAADQEQPMGLTRRPGISPAQPHRLGPAGAVIVVEAAARSGSLITARTRSTRGAR